MTTLLIIAVMILIGGAYVIGFRRGENKVLDDMHEASLRAEEKREEIDKDVQSRPDDQLNRDADKWMRD